MTDQPDQDATTGAAEGSAYDADVRTEDNTGGFKPGRDDTEDED